MSSRIPERQDADVVNDVTTCPICNRKYTVTEPKVEAKLLPCLDTFCMQCLDAHVHNLTTNYPWSTISCQLCQTPLEIPEGRLQKLKTNPVVSILLKIAAITSDPADGRHVCDACDQAIIEGRAEGRAPPAEVYCEECDQKLCKDCRCAHGKLRPTKPHGRVVRLGSEESRKLALELKEMLPRCAKHKLTPGELYCTTCGVFLCNSCGAAHSKTHGLPCRMARELAQELRAKVSEYSLNLAKLQQASRGKRDTISEHKAAFCTNIEATRKMIGERARVLKEIIDQHKEDLLKQLEKIRSETEDAFVEAEEAARRNERGLARFCEFAVLTSNLDLATLKDLYPMVCERATVLTDAKDVSSVRLISVSFAPGLWQQTVMSGGQNCLGSIGVDIKRWPPETQTL